LFPLTEAPIFAILGVSHLSAQLTVAVYWFVLLWAVWRLATRFLSGAVALGAVLLFASLHELAFWGRQVMLEVPVYAWMAWAAVMYLRYLDTRWAPYLYALATFCVLALYTKQTSAFLVLTFTMLLPWEAGRSIWRERHLWGAIVLAALALIPLVALTLKFGQVNVSATMGETGRELSRLSLANWWYYASKMPGQVGWPVLGLALAYALGRWWRPDWRLPGREERLLAAWLVVGYAFFSLIGLKEVRHSLPILLPLPLFAAAALFRLVPARAAAPATLGLAAVSLAVTLFLDPVPSVKGYDRAADFVASHAPRGSLVLFSGYRDGSFVFNLRSHGERDDLGVLRSDKVLLKVKVKRETGVQERGVPRQELARRLNEYGVSYVVNQPSFWADLDSMRMLQDLLHSPQFVKEGHIQVNANVPHEDQVLEVYRNVQYVPGGHARPKLELLIIDQEI
jgi:4-amino-4-deoxy-L-arabinose transferase-like glycosyltransferase